MKVFLSWSGEVSHKVALALRDWLPSVIQDVVPYVSSEDIDKGTRWSSDIASELEESSFGILCVTKENLGAPWLCFEAGALSKTIDKSFVSPFLYNIKRSEVSGPILQFQSTIFEKEDVFKLISTVYATSSINNLNEDRLKKTFDVWWPQLEEALGQIKEADPQPQNGQTEDIDTNRVLEEILELSRLNQKLLRDPDISIREQLQELQHLTAKMMHEREMLMSERNPKSRSSSARNFHQELDYLNETRGNVRRLVYLQMLLSFSKDKYPWVYDVGMDMIKAIKAQPSKPRERELERMFDEFMNLMAVTFRSEAFQARLPKEERMFFSEYFHLVMRELEQLRSEDWEH